MAAQADQAGLRRVVGRDPAARPQARERADEDQAAAGRQQRHRATRHEEVRAQVDLEDLVPDLGRGALEAHAAGDADVAHHAVDAAERLVRLVDEALAVVRLRHVGDDPHRTPALLLDQGDGLVGGLGADVDDGDSGALARGEHRGRLAVAGRRVGVVVGHAARADHDDALALQAPAAGRGALRLGRKLGPLGLPAHRGEYAPPGIRPVV